MSENEKRLLAIHDLIVSAEKSLTNAKKMYTSFLHDQGVKRKKIHFDTDSLHAYDSGETKIIEGVFTGESMFGSDQNMYPVPANYASKSLLVQGSKLKATIQPSGKILYKIIEEIPSDSKKGIVISDKGRLVVQCDGKTYKTLTAAMSYLKVTVGDHVIIRVPKGKDATFACVESIVPNLEEKDSTEEKSLDIAVS